MVHKYLNCGGHWEAVVFLDDLGALQACEGHADREQRQPSDASGGRTPLAHPSRVAQAWNAGLSSQRGQFGGLGLHVDF